MKLSATKAKTPSGEPIWKVWEVKAGGKTFEIDGQNGADDGSNEWQIIIDNIAVDVVPTKRDALEWIEKFLKEANA